MRNITVFVALLFVTLDVQAQQPLIRVASVVNAANNLQRGLPNAGLAQGAMFVLKGRNLGARGTVIANSFPLLTTMGGTSMRIAVGTTTVNVIMVYVVGGLSDDQGPFDQLAGIVPSNTPTGNGTLTVTFNNATSTSVPVTILPNAFGIFTINQQGTGPGVFTDPNFKVNTLVNAAHAGESWFIWGTGLGAINGSDANAPPVGNLNVPAEVYVGGVKATIGYQGRSGCCSGLDQILITIPTGVTGCYVPVVIKIGNIVSNFTSMSIAQSGNICSDPGGFSVTDLQKAQSDPKLTIAGVILFRFSVKFSAAGLSAQGVIDDGEGHFHRYDRSPSGILAALPYNDGIPSVGCMVYPIPEPGTEFLDFQLNPNDNAPRGVDAGPSLSINGPTGAKQLLRRNNAGSGFGYGIADDSGLGGGIPGISPIAPEYLVPGTFTISNGSGGPDVGGFSANITIGSPPANFWANMDAVTNIPRTQDLTINLASAGSSQAVLLAESVGGGVAVSISCVAPPGATSFTIPSYVLSALPASGLASDIAGRTGYMGVGLFTANGTRVQARGVDGGSINGAFLSVKNVNFQ